MADHSLIEWTDATWNVITGCTLMSEGCRNCYAATLAATRLNSHWSREGLARVNAAGQAKFTGEVRFNERWLEQPLHWAKPRRIFVCAHGDLFHEGVKELWLDKIFAVMAGSPHHTFQVLTKRPDRLRTYLLDKWARFRIAQAWLEVGRNIPESAPGWKAANWALSQLTGRKQVVPSQWPLANVWVGTSAEDAASYRERWGHVAATPAVVRMLSAEPLLGDLDDLDLGRVGAPNWVIVGGESGRHARPMHPDWVRSAREQCAKAGVPFLFKQWGEWLPWEPAAVPTWRSQAGGWLDGNTMPDFNDADLKGWSDACLYEGAEVCVHERVGKKAAGRQLDGVVHDGWPA